MSADSKNPEQSDEVDALEKDYVLLNSDIEPDNDLIKEVQVPQPFDEATSRFVELTSMATCLSPTDLKARLRTIPNLIETFHKNFEKLKNEARNDADRIQSEIFELYSNFFALVKSILATVDSAEKILYSSMKCLKDLRDEKNPNVTCLIQDLSQNGADFKALFNENDSRLNKNKFDISDREFIDRLEKLKSELSTVHPTSPASSLSMTEWVKYAHIFKVGTKLILPLWHISYLLFFGVAFGASLVGLTEYFTYYKNHSGFIYLNSCLSELYALEELSIVMNAYVSRSATAGAAGSGVVGATLDQDQHASLSFDELFADTDKKAEIDMIINCALKHCEEMSAVMNELKKIDLKKFVM